MCCALVRALSKTPTFLLMAAMGVGSENTCDGRGKLNQLQTQWVVGHVASFFGPHADIMMSVSNGCRTCGLLCIGFFILYIIVSAATSTWWPHARESTPHGDGMGCFLPSGSVRCYPNFPGKSGQPRRAPPLATFGCPLQTGADCNGRPEVGKGGVLRATRKIGQHRTDPRDKNPTPCDPTEVER
jgi:hypothetical protein